MMQWTRAARDAHGPNFLLFPEPASFSASEYRRGDTMLTSPFSGPVGFQYSNIAMAKGMFTSIGMALRLFHPLPLPA